MRPHLKSLAGFVCLSIAAGPRPADEAGAPRAAATAAPDVVRATVQIRNGDTRGSGTVIASERGLTLVLTAAHVVKKATEVRVEIHRHNLGQGATVLTEGGGWPRVVKATVVASDPATDVALLRLDGVGPLRYVARLDPSAPEPRKGEVLTSVGIDRGLFLTRWKTRIEGVAFVDIGQDRRGARRFLVTTRHPEHGRSGGGLFRDDGTVIGLCTGMVSVEPGRPKVGLFASTPSVLDLLRSQGVLQAGPAPGGGGR